MDMTSLPRQVLDWDIKLGAKGWMKDVVNICENSNIPVPTMMNFVYDLEPIQNRFIRACREER